MILVVAKVREKLTVRKQAGREFDVGSFNLRSLSKLEVTKQYEIKISNRFAPFENLNDTEDINRV